MKPGFALLQHLHPGTQPVAEKKKKVLIQTLTMFTLGLILAVWDVRFAPPHALRDQVPISAASFHPFLAPGLCNSSKGSEREMSKVRTFEVRHA